jgi:crossover junction endodeoxyribonuclease RuvC
VAYVERVAARPGQGVASMFGFGVSYGLLRGVLTAKLIPVTLVTPQEWKRGTRTPAAKDAARARASEVFPGHAGLWALKKHDGRAEAALIAHFGMGRERATLREMLG